MGELVPVTLTRARQFVSEHHRHNVAPRGWLFGVGLEEGGELVGVGIASRPVARMLDDSRTVEIVRLTVSDRAGLNSCSRLYGALCRAAAALGYARAVTYTLASEPGSSVMAAGFRRDAELDARPGWAGVGRPLSSPGLFGETTLPNTPKVRWIRPLRRACGG